MRLRQPDARRRCSQRKKKEERLKIILHAGTPKTGTTSLQLFLHRHRDALRDRGVLYPSAGITPPPEPKHQWMIGGLMREDPRDFRGMLAAALEEARPDTHTMILSSEGLFHRWWDFSPEGRGALQELSARFPLEVWAFFREPVSFIRSFYIQMLKNPRGSGPCYGEDLSLGEMLDRPRFSIHLDYIGYIRAVEEALGAGTVRPFRYGGNTVGDVLAALGIRDLDPAAPRENRTVGSLGVALLRVMNRETLGVQQKQDAVRLVEELDRLADGAARPLQIEPGEITRIQALAAESVSAFRDIYSLDLATPPHDGSPNLTMPV
ncbi:hypothetical protein [Roseixanthobacter glucoisosaccharinicivorans]|uniref:hypothetical protein n=1 Tax=Roseixanthobacter glucoisosaccharinicivorans TaxID=3119923 RepID=UPI0037271FBE